MIRLSVAEVADLVDGELTAPTGADVRGAAVLLGSLREQRVHTHLEA